MENPTTIVALLVTRLATLARDDRGMSTVEYDSESYTLPW